MDLNQEKIFYSDIQNTISRTNKKQKKKQNVETNNKEQKAESALWEVMCTCACKHKSKNLLRCNVVQRKSIHAAFRLLCIVD